MGFILVPRRGEDVCVNAWNWRPTLELLRAAQVLEEEKLDLMGANLYTEVSAEEAQGIARFLDTYLPGLEPDSRVLYDLTVTREQDTGEIYRDDLTKNYSATASWLTRFRDFCRTSAGFNVA